MTVEVELPPLVVLRLFVEDSLGVAGSVDDRLAPMQLALWGAVDADAFLAIVVDAFVRGRRLVVASIGTRRAINVERNK